MSADEKTCKGDSPFCRCEQERPAKGTVPFAGFDAVSRARKALQGFEPYDPAFTPCRVNLSANENTHDVPMAFFDALREAMASTPLNRYPDPMADDLRRQIAERHGVEVENVLVGNGGDEILFNLFFTFGGPGHALVTCPPDFSEYANFAKMCEMPVVSAWRDPETFAIDVDALVAAVNDVQAAMVVLTSPNNPTGDLVDPAIVRRLLDETDALVLLDEAYVEFAGVPELLGEDKSLVGWVAENPRLMVLRTLSKAFGLAGLRVGYLVADPAVVDMVGAIRQLYSEDVIAQSVAVQAVGHRELMVPVVADIVDQRERLAERLAALPGARVWPSSANFVLLRVPGAATVRARLRDEHSILVRDFSAAPGLADCLRITVGTAEENDLLVDALTSLVKETA